MKKRLLMKKAARVFTAVCIIALVLCCMTGCEALWKHIWGEHTYTVETTLEPTCTKPGEKTYTCSCGEKYVEELEALGLDYRHFVTEPTCVENGYTTHICSRCSYKYIDSYSDSLGHKLGEWITIIEPSCTESGLEERVCECSEKENRIIPPKGHDFGEWTRIKEPTCSENGIDERECFCGEKEILSVSAVPHTEGEWVYKNNYTEHHLIKIMSLKCILPTRSAYVIRFPMLLHARTQQNKKKLSFLVPFGYRLCD